MHRTLRTLLVFVLLAAAGFATYAPMVPEWRKKAEAGDAIYQELMGECYADDASSDGIPLDYVEAVKWHRLAAEQGYAKAQFNLAVLYVDGTGVPKDYVEAMKWNRLAAGQGYADAQYNLGYMHAHGEGVPQDYGEAVKWYRLAAEQGYASAQTNLGTLYWFGEGVPKDLVQAHVWLNISAAKGNKLAKEKMPILEKEMSDSQKEKAMDMARELFAKLPKGK